MHFCTAKAATLPSNEVLELLIEQMDAKHLAAHRRLRDDLTEGFAEMGREQEKLEARQRADHELIVRHHATRERRRELSGYRSVIIAATIGGGCQVIVVLLSQLFALLK